MQVRTEEINLQSWVPWLPNVVVLLYQHPAEAMVALSETLSIAFVRNGGENPADSSTHKHA